MTAESHWVRWHRAYDLDASPLRLRLEIVQRHLAAAITARAAEGTPIRIVSLCAGQGRDVTGALDGHPSARAVSARLVELDPQLVADARAEVARLGLESVVEVVEGDASWSDCCDGAVPADVVVACGIFGNISDHDIHEFTRKLPTLCAPGAHVIWTRHRRPPDLTPAVRAWFAEAGFDEIAFESPDEHGVVGVGVHRLAAAPRPNEPGTRLFHFVGDGSAA